ncbi:MAG: tRNA threonylcarbamoyladenosine dehydratase [Lachnospiraceae bacterium]|nr:tRNA threonylcarbamoyladenosine dehydratase [Lachnospiraceae bacterium]
MSEQFSRTELLLGKEKMERLFHARVAVFGIGGVGGYTVEALARSGIGTLDLIDDDKICMSNLNRQIYALHDTVGKYKVDVAKERIRQINPTAKVNGYKIFYMPDTARQFDFSQYDYVVDAIDTVTGKIALAEQAERSGTPIISCMGAGNKMDASALEVADIYETSICPLARVMRRELKKRGIQKLKVVYSREPAMQPIIEGRCASDDVPAIEESGSHLLDAVPAIEESGSHQTDAAVVSSHGTTRRQVPGSNAFVPAVAGLIIAGEVVKDLSAAERV